MPPKKRKTASKPVRRSGIGASKRSPREAGKPVPKKKVVTKKKSAQQSLLLQPLTLLCLAIVVLLSYLTYFHNYQFPEAPFWDENYYITDAQREMNGVHYMQIHPPLGKQLIALGEVLIDANEEDAQFLNTEHAKNFPKGFSFEGYRLFPALMAWLIAPLLFAIFIILTRNPLIATLLSFLYIFDNALIVHSRGAMLEPPLQFFMVLSILLFLVLFHLKDRKKEFLWTAALFGIAIGCAVATKMNGLILVLLFLPLAWKMRKEGGNLICCLITITLAALIIFASVWYVHFSRMEIVNPELRSNGYYLASDEYKSILDEGKQASLSSFPIMLRDSLKYMPHYNKGIPKLDLCKPDENGSPVFLWPIGATTINYRWQNEGENARRYLYLVPNPVVWFAGLAGVILSVVFVLGPLFYKRPRTAEHKEKEIMMLTFLMLYGSYMVAYSMMDRVHFLYSYFPALIFSFILLGIVISQLQAIGNWLFTEERKILLSMLLACMIFLSFTIYRPFTYYEPLTKEQIENRAIMRMWNLRCVGCEKPSPLVRRQCKAS